MKEEEHNWEKEGEEGSDSARDSEKQSAHASSRARNQTVILTPEITDQVRALLNKEEGEAESVQDPLSDLLPSMGWDRPAEPSTAATYDALSAVNEEGVSSLVPDEAEKGRVRSRKDTGKIKQQKSVVASPAESQPQYSVKNQETEKSGREMAIRTSSTLESASQTKIVGFFVSFDTSHTGEVYEVRVGRWLVTSRPTEHGDYLLIRDESISPLHAIIRATEEGKIQVLDQLSEFGTGLLKVGAKKEEEVSGAMVVLEHGDIVRLGTRSFVVCTVPVREASSASAKNE